MGCLQQSTEAHASTACSVHSRQREREREGERKGDGEKECLQNGRLTYTHTYAHSHPHCLRAQPAREYDMHCVKAVEQDPPYLIKDPAATVVHMGCRAARDLDISGLF